MYEDERIRARLPEACLPGEQELIWEAARLVGAKSGVKRHDLLVVLGSGLHQVIDVIQTGLAQMRARVSYEELGVPLPSAPGHGHELCSVEMDGVNVLVATGRSHLYEGLEPAQICRLARIAAACGVWAGLLTNAGGCLQDWRIGDVMLIGDHVNLSAQTPFDLPSFTDIWSIWDADFKSALRPLTQREGVYALLRGPEFQTRAESLMLRAGGIDMVGMSTILEAIALHQLGVRLAGLSVVSDLSFATEPCTHEAVLAAMRAAVSPVSEAISVLVQKLR